MIFRPMYHPVVGFSDSKNHSKDGVEPENSSNRYLHPGKQWCLCMAFYRKYRGSPLQGIMLWSKAISKAVVDVVSRRVAMFRLLFEVYQG